MNKTLILKRLETFRNPFLLFSPFLLVSLIWIIAISTPAAFEGDESKYLNYAKNLLQGFYSPPAPHIYLGVGPGYSLFISPFIAIKIPLVYIICINAVFYYLSIIFLYKTLILIAEKPLAITVSLFWAFYYNLYDGMQYIGPETMTPFIISALIYTLVKSFNSQNLLSEKYLYLAGFVFGYLVLTKIIFGYVLLFMLAGSALLWLFNRKSIYYRKGLMILLVALLTTSPYLLYTYNLTGKFFYWGTTAGNNLYWMSTPFEKEYGSWSPDPIKSSDSANIQKNLNEFRRDEYNKILNNDENIPGTGEYIWNNHHKNFEGLNKLSGVEQDAVLKRIAFRNITTNPVKFTKNLISNLGRIVFNYPYSYKLQNPGTLLRFPANGIIVTLLLFSLIPAVLNWKKIIYPVRFSVFIFILYLGGSLTGSAETRMFTAIVPILLLWIAYVFQRALKINWRFSDNN